jgi:hypothetical protein
MLILILDWNICYNRARLNKLEYPLGLHASGAIICLKDCFAN